MRRWLDQNGNAGIEGVLMTFFMLLLVIMPLVALIFERFYYNMLYYELRSAVDISCTSAYEALSAEGLGEKWIQKDDRVFQEQFEELLKANLHLDEHFSPDEGSALIQSIKLNRIGLYDDFQIPGECPMGRELDVPTAHVELEVEVAPMLFRSMVTSNENADYMRTLHIDVELPVDRRP